MAAGLVLAGKGTRFSQTLELIDLETGQSQTLREGAYPAWSPSGHILFQTAPRSPGLWALPFSLRTRKAEGEPVPLLNGGSDFSASADGTLVWADAGIGGLRKLVWRDRSGKKLADTGSPQTDIQYLSLSPDGAQAAYAAAEGGNQDVWIVELAHAVRTRFTFTPEVDRSPTWTPSGREIAFSSQRSDRSDILVQPSDGSGEPKAVVSGPLTQFATGWSPDGMTLLFHRVDPKTGLDLWKVRRKADGTFEQPSVWLQSPFGESRGSFSPDGRYVLYVSNESGRNEVYVRSFPDGGGRRQVSSGGGENPRWRRDGKEIFYVQGDALIAVEVNAAGDSLAIGAATELLRSPGLVGMISPSYDAAPDGKRFLISEPAGENTKPPAIHVIQNWAALPRQKAGSE